MKRLIIGLFVFALLASSCAPAENQGTSLPVANSATSTPSPLPTATATASVTPLPTIPTFTPKFDASTILTVTPAPRAECPTEKQNQSTTHLFPESGEPYDKTYIDRILEFLNDGGTVNTLVSELNRPSKWGRAYGDLTLTDITNDGVPELFITILFSHFVLKCESQIYEIIYKRDDVISGTILSTSDLNRNSILELHVSISPCADTFCPEMWLYEWDGKELTTINHNTDDVISTADINGDGITEIIGIDFPWSKEYDLRPTGREITRIYFWNGYYFMEQPYYSDPVFRFQAIQDADIESLKNNFNRALQLYDEAIGNKNLGWWSPERNKFETEQSYTALSSENIISTQPSPDPSEYPRLAAYAYYRIMLLHFMQGNESEATATYSTLQQTFGNDPYARPYVEMATAFWDAYQSMHKMYDGCAAAIQYAVEHPEILIPLGSDYHGAQAKIYKPEDVCPFR